MAKPNVGAIPGSGPITKPRPKKVIRKKPPAQKIPKPDTSKARPLPKAPAQKVSRPDTSKARPIPKVAKPQQTRVPGTGPVVSAHLERHRQNKAAKQVRGEPVNVPRPDTSKARPIPKLHGLKGTGTAKVNRVTVPELQAPIVDLGLDPKASPTIDAILHPTGAAGQAKNFDTAFKAAQKGRKYVQGELESARAGRDRVLTGGPPSEGEKILKGVEANALQFPEQAAATGVAVGKAGVEAARGNPKPAETLAKGLTDGFVGNLVKGNPKKAIKYAEDNPLFAALEVAGVHSAVGRGLGAAARGGPSKTLRKAATTKRAPVRIVLDVNAGPAKRKIPLSGQIKHRHYSKNVLTKVVQVVADKRRGEHGSQLEARKLHTSPSRDPAHQQRQGINDVADTSEGVRRLGRAESRKRMKKIKPQPKHVKRSTKKALADVVDLAAQFRIRPSTEAKPRQAHEDLVKLHTRLLEQQPTLKGADLKANRQQVDQIKAVLDDPAAVENLAHVFDSAAKFAPTAREVSKARVVRGIDTAKQSARRIVLPYAIEHMGAREGKSPVYVAAKAEAKSAEAAVGRMQRKAQSEGRRAAKVQGAAEVRVGIADRRALAAEPTVKAAQAQHTTLARENVRAQRYARNVARDPKATPAIRQAAVRDAKLTAGRVRQSRAQLKTVTSQVPRIGTKPAGTLRRLERSRAAQLEAEKAVPRLVKKAEEAHARAKLYKHETAFVHADGRQLSTDEIITHMRANGADPKLASYVSGDPSVKGARAYFQNFAQGRASGVKRFTGKSIVKGTGGSGYQALIDEAVRQSGQIDRVRTFDQFVKYAGIGKEGGKYFNWGDAVQFAKDFEAETGEVLVPLRAFNAKHDAKVVETFQQPHNTRTDLISKTFDNAQTAPPRGTEGVENVVLVPEAEMNQLMGLQRRASTAGGRIGRKVTNLFRGIVLPFSPRWMAGNTLEAALRLAVRGISPHDVHVGRKVLAATMQLDRQAGRELLARTKGSMLFGSRDRHQIVDPTQLAKLTRGEALTGTLVRLPVLRQLGMVIKGWQDLAFGANTAMENFAATAVLGKFSRREIQEFSDSWITGMRAHPDAIMEAARGHLGTAKQIEFAAYLDETLGKYRRFSPTMQMVVQNFAPFLPWYANAFRFVYWTLPVHHPLKTALFTKTEATLQDQWQQQNGAAPPGDLRGGVASGRGGYIPLAHYGPFGAFTGNGPQIDDKSKLWLPIAGLPDFILPQLSGPAAILQGRSPISGAKLKGDDGQPLTDNGNLTAMLALNSVFETYVPLVSWGRRFAEGGKSSADTSTIFSPKVKPESESDAPANRILNPFRTIHPGGTGSSTSGGGAGTPVFPGSSSAGGAVWPK